MSTGKKSLVDLLKDKQKVSETELIQRQIEVEKQATAFTSHISSLNDHIHSKFTQLHAKIDDIEGKLEEERMERNRLEQRKTEEGRQIGQLYWENLRSLGAAAQEKIDQVKGRLENKHQNIKQTQSEFVSLQESLERETPKSFIAHAGEYRVQFTQEKNRLEEGVRSLEVSVERELGRVMDLRVEMIETVEGEVAATRKEASLECRRLAAEIQDRAQNLKALLAHFAQTHQLTA